MKRFFYLSVILLVSFFQANSQLLYEISGNGLKKPSYIFGTHHLAPLSILDSIRGFSQAFDACEQIVGEIDMTGNIAAMAMKMQPYMTAPPDSTLDKIIPPERYAAANAKFKEVFGNKSVSLDMFKTLRPTAISNIICQTVMQRDLPDFNINLQLDSHIQKIGKENGKSILALETPEMQAELLFCFYPLKRQADELLDILDNTDELKNQVKKLNEAYLGRDLLKLTEVCLEEETDPDFFNSLLRKRNLNWMLSIPSIISTHPTLIVVGALHLPTEDGLLRLLSASGYKITPIN